jgi:hypothetical protein
LTTQNIVCRGKVRPAKSRRRHRQAWRDIGVLVEPKRLAGVIQPEHRRRPLGRRRAHLSAAVGRALYRFWSLQTEQSGQRTACPGLGLRSPHAHVGKAVQHGRSSRPMLNSSSSSVGQATQNNLAICWYIHMSAGMASISPRSVGQVVPDAAAADGAFSPARRSALLANGFSSGEAAPSRRAFVDHLLTDDNRDARQNDHR